MPEIQKSPKFKGCLTISFENRDTETMTHLMRRSGSEIDIIALKNDLVEVDIILAKFPEWKQEMMDWKQEMMNWKQEMSVIKSGQETTASELKDLQDDFKHLSKN